MDSHRFLSLFLSLTLSSRFQSVSFPLIVSVPLWFQQHQKYCANIVFSFTFKIAVRMCVCWSSISLNFRFEFDLWNKSIQIIWFDYCFSLCLILDRSVNAEQLRTIVHLELHAYRNGKNENKILTLNISRAAADLFVNWLIWLWCI